MTKKRSLLIAAAAAAVVVALYYMYLKKRAAPAPVPIPSLDPGVTIVPTSTKYALSSQVGAVGYGELNVSPPRPTQTMYTPAWLVPNMGVEAAVQACMADARCGALMVVTATQNSVRNGKPEIMPSRAPPTTIAPFTVTGGKIWYGPREASKGPTIYIKGGLAIDKN